jgi:DNA-binding transcriptional ArsR family regulator
MEIYQLRAFVTVAKIGHLTRAAEVLHVTQPAVTGQIKALEEELGIALFDRRPGRICSPARASACCPRPRRCWKPPARCWAARASCRARCRARW